MPEDIKMQDAPERAEEQEELEIPAYEDRLELKEEDKKRLSKQINLELDEIKKEYEKKGFVTDKGGKWVNLENQYEGRVKRNEDQMFNLHKHTTKVKCDTVELYMKKAFLKSEPIYSITPRPEYEREGGRDTCEAQQDYLDYKLDHGGIPFRGPIGRVLHNATVKNGGILKVVPEIRMEKRTRTEHYEGNPVLTVQRVNKGSGEPYTVKMTIKEVEKLKDKNIPYQIQEVHNEGLEAFYKAYPDGEETYPGYVKKLQEGKTIDIEVLYDEVTYNDPLPKNVKPENFYVRLSTEGYEGLKTTKLIAERRNYLWWDLIREERKGKFEDIDELMYQYDADKKMKGYKDKKQKDKKDVMKPGYEQEDFDIIECVFHFKIKETDEEETKIVCWMDEDSGRIIGAKRYAINGLDCYYFPFFLLDKWEGFWQPGLAEYMTDLNLGENAVLNFTLEAVFMRNMITPITQNEDIIEQFIDRSWTHGLTLEANPEEIDFLQRHMAQIDTGSLVGLAEYLTKGGDDVSRVSSYITGRESEIDPNAPASKTLALLKQSGIGIEEFINSMLEPFNMVANAILQITYQMSEEGRKYATRDKVTEGEPFKTISKEDMIARTNIQSQAMAFNLDELNAKRENLALYSAVRQEPLIARNPEAVYTILKAMIKSWSPAWRNMVDSILPPLAQFKKEQQQIAVQAVGKYIEMRAMEAESEGTPMNFNPNEVLATMNEATSQAVTSPDPKKLAQEKKEQEAGNA